MIYNFNLGIGWASSGVEYAQIYRAKLFRRLGQDAKFIFTDMFSQENIEHYTKNIGFLDSEIIWLYTYFTNIKIAPVIYQLSDFEKTFSQTKYTKTREGKIVRYYFEGEGNFCTAYMVDEKSEKVHRIEIVVKGFLIQKDYFTYVKVYSEYYAPVENKAHLYHRRFFNEDGSIAYEEIIHNGTSIYRFSDKILCSKEELIGYMVSKLKLNSDDLVIIDRAKGIGQAILENAYSAKKAMVVHAEHYNVERSNQDYILWNNFYEYPFMMHKHIDFYIMSTELQKQYLINQFQKYKNVKGNVYAIPVGSIDQLKYPKSNRKPYSLITASRLASEKHIDWIIHAVVEAHKINDKITFDIYGKGKEEQTLQRLIESKKAQDYIQLKGHRNLENIYEEYEAYISASTSEGFGLTLMEAVGSGLPIIGFDVPYGNPTFIKDGKNGFLISYTDLEEEKKKINALKEKIIDLFNQDLKSFHENSYEIAKKYLTKEVEKKWREIL